MFDAPSNLPANEAPPSQVVCGFTAEDIAQVLSDLLPQGWVWPRDPESVQQRALLGIAEEMRRIQARDCQLLEEAYPCGATETITDWERVLGLPDPCTGLLETLQQRRAAICGKMSIVGGATRQAIEDFLNELGYEVEVEEGPERFDFTVWTAGVTPVWFRASESLANEALRTWGNELLECAIEYVKPAHTRAILHYLVPAEWDDGQSEWDDGQTWWDEGVRPPEPDEPDEPEPEPPDPEPPDEGGPDEPY
jgi:uncharacterized protein YmfQ (DUF2313 family)